MEEWEKKWKQERLEAFERKQRKGGGQLWDNTEQDLKELLKNISKQEGVKFEEICHFVEVALGIETLCMPPPQQPPPETCTQALKTTPTSKNTSTLSRRKDMVKRKCVEATGFVRGGSSLSNVPSEKLQRILSAKGLRNVGNQGGGDCLWYGFLQAVNAHSYINSDFEEGMEGMMRLRRSVADFVRGSLGLFDGIHQFGGNFRDVGEWAKSLEQQGRWAENREIQALCTYFSVKCCVHLWKSADNDLCPSPIIVEPRKTGSAPGGALHTVHILQYNEQHFECLLPVKSTPQSKKKPQQPKTP